VSKPFAAGPLAILFLEIAGGDVVHAGVSADVAERVFATDVAGAATDHHAQFTLEVDTLRSGG
jgi:hypothetical protein